MLFSVVIPTRNRVETLTAAIQTCLDQSFDDFEVIVSDNSDEPVAAQALAHIGALRIKVVRPTRLLSMSENWEFAFGHASGRYIFFMGDDDGLLPEALQTLARLIARHEPPAIVWRKADFVWPQDEAGTLELPTNYYGYTYQAAQAVDQALSFRAGRPWLPYNRLPTLYNAVVSQTVLTQIVAATGRLFWSSQPDVFSGIAIASSVRSYLYFGFPFSINGGSKYSNGRSVDPEVKSDFLRLSADVSNEACPLGLLAHAKSIASCVLEAAFYAHHKGLIPRPPYERMIAAVRHDLIAAGVPHDDAYFERLRHACAVSRKVAGWDLPDPRPLRHAARPRVGAARGNLEVEPQRVGVRTVSDAARFLNGLLPWGAIGDIELRPGPRRRARIASLAHRLLARAVPDQHL